MSSIDHFDLRSFDLNLLIAFDALMEERAVTRAAARLKIGQPAMSHNLATLRMLFQDELFVRVGQSMQPTMRARALAPRVREALLRIQETLRADQVFDPASESRTFRIGFSSDLEVLILPELSAAMRREAPGVKLQGRPVHSEVVFDLLDDGQLDLAIGCYEARAERHRAEMLFETAISCCFNPALLPFETPLTREAYLSADHAMISLNDSLQGCLDATLQASGAQLNVVAAGAEILSLLAIVSRAPVVATMPSRMAERYAALFGLATSPTPLELRTPPVSVVWSAQADRDPGVEWLRGLIPAMVGEQRTENQPEPFPVYPSSQMR